MAASAAAKAAGAPAPAPSLFAPPKPRQPVHNAVASAPAAAPARLPSKPRQPEPVTKPATSVAVAPRVETDGPRTYSLAELQAVNTPLPKGVPPDCKEEFLSESGFKDVFGVARADFNALPGWKRASLKKKHGLF